MLSSSSVDVVVGLQLVDLASFAAGDDDERRMSGSLQVRPPH